MEINVFLDNLKEIIDSAKEIIDSAKEKNVEIVEVDIVADNYCNCLQFSNEKGDLLAEIDFADGVVPIFYSALIE